VVTGGNYFYNAVCEYMCHLLRSTAQELFSYATLEEVHKL